MISYYYNQENIYDPTIEEIFESELNKIINLENKFSSNTQNIIYDFDAVKVDNQIFEQEVALPEDISTVISTVPESTNSVLPQDVSTLAVEIVDESTNTVLSEDISSQSVSTVPETTNSVLLQAVSQPVSQPVSQAVPQAVPTSQAVPPSESLVDGPESVFDGPESLVDGPESLVDGPKEEEEESTQTKVDTKISEEETTQKISVSDAAKESTAGDLTLNKKTGDLSRIILDSPINTAEITVTNKKKSNITSNITEYETFDMLNRKVFSIYTNKKKIYVRICDQLKDKLLETISFNINYYNSIHEDFNILDKNLLLDGNYNLEFLPNLVDDTFQINLRSIKNKDRSCRCVTGISTS